jgi:hypothetical protein
MSELTIKQILHTADGIKDKPIFTDWDVACEAVAALRALVAATDRFGNRCFCDQWKDPGNLQHSGACLNAQDVLRRADSL